MNKTALLVGATGLIGHSLLEELIENTEYNKILVVARNIGKLTRLKKDKLKILSFSDIDNKISDEIKVDDFYCALGTTQKKSGRQGLKYVDFTLVVQCAEWAIKHGASIASVVSAVGSNPRSPFFYNRIKGQMEIALEKLNFQTVLLWRPSVLIGKREEQRVAEEIAGVFLGSRVFKHLQSYPANNIAKVIAMVTPNHVAGIYRYGVIEIKQFYKPYSQTGE